MKTIIIMLAFVLAVPCYCYPGTVEDEIEKLAWMPDEEEYGPPRAEQAPCREFEAFLIIGFVGIMRECFLIPEDSKCRLNQLGVMVAFYFYYTECLFSESEQ